VRNVILKARQLGFTTLVCLLMLDACLFNSGVNAGIIAHNKDDAEKFFDVKIRRVYERLPEQLKSARPAKEDRAGQLTISHGDGRYSRISVGTSHRSGTLQWLLISEYGKLCAKTPERAKEVRTGAIPAAQRGVIFVESTAEGAEGGFFDMCQASQARAQLEAPLTPADFKFHFFAWHEDPQYRLSPDGVVIAPAMAEYFRKLHDDHGIALDAEQRAWYAKEAEIQGDDMLREYPSRPEEAFFAAIEGAYYSRELAQARKDKRIGRSPWDASLPVYTWWDIGVDDYMACWFVQLIGAEVRFIEYREWSDVGFVQVVKDLKNLPYRYGKMAQPHDVRAREVVSGAPRVQYLLDAGFDVEIAPAAPIGDGIHQVRTLFSRFWFDEEKCADGLKRLAGYRKEWSPTAGQFLNKPKHDENSHGADALRTGAQVIDRLQPPAVSSAMPANPFPVSSWMSL